MLRLSMSLCSIVKKIFTIFYMMSVSKAKPSPKNKQTTAYIAATQAATKSGHVQFLSLVATHFMGFPFPNIGRLGASNFRILSGIPDWSKSSNMFIRQSASMKIVSTMSTHNRWVFEVTKWFRVAVAAKQRGRWDSTKRYWWKWRPATWRFPR